MNNFEQPISQPNETSGLIAKAEEIERIILEGKRKDEKEKEAYYAYFKKQLEQLGAVEYEQWQEKLQEMEDRDKELIVRREDPQKLFDALFLKSDLQIRPSTEHGIQPNAAMLGSDLSGLRVALAGGFGKVGKGSVVVTAGFTPSENFNVKNIPDDEFINFQGKDRRLAKMVDGKIPFEDIKFVLLRMPADFFPEDKMTDDELERESAHIQRMFVFEKTDNKKGPVVFN